MSSQSKKEHPDHQNAYQKMLQRISDYLEHPEEKTESILHHAVDYARDTAVKLRELSKEESEQIALSVKRDIVDAGDFLNKTGKGLHDWFAFDWMVLEDQLRELFIKASDQARVHLINFNQELERGPIYKTDEIAGPGTLQCQKCGTLIQLKKVSTIPECPDCKAREFLRIKK